MIKQACLSHSLSHFCQNKLPAGSDFRASWQNARLFMINTVSGSHVVVVVVVLSVSTHTDILGDIAYICRHSIPYLKLAHMNKGGGGGGGGEKEETEKRNKIE